jgi:hypothetical protein
MTGYVDTTPYPSSLNLTDFGKNSEGGIQQKGQSNRRSVLAGSTGRLPRHSAITPRFWKSCSTVLDGLP